MTAMASQITSLTIVYSSIYSGADQRKLQSSASLAFVQGTHWWPVNSPHKWPVMRKMFSFDDVIMRYWFSNPHPPQYNCHAFFLSPTVPFLSPSPVYSLLTIHNSDPRRLFCGTQGVCAWPKLSMYIAGNSYGIPQHVLIEFTVLLLSGWLNW